MPDSAATSNVFLDTQALEAHQFDFDSRNLRLLIRLAAEGHIRVVLTTVTVSEIQAHIDDHAKKAYRQIDTLRRISPLVKSRLSSEAHAVLASASEEEFRLSMRTAFDKFLADTKATILSVDSVSPEAVFKKYFESQPPFGDGNKKSEFPDAFASAALQAWCSTEGNAKIYVVSDDKDWRRTCSGDGALVHIGQVSELLEKFADFVLVTAIKDALTAKKDQLKALIEGKAKDLYYFSTDGVEAEIEEVEEAEVEIEDAFVVDAEDGNAVANVFCTLRYKVFVVDDDPESGIYDHEEGGMHYVYRRSGSVEGEVERSVTVDIAYDQARPENIVFQAIAFDRDEVDVDLEDASLSREDEGEDEHDYYEEPPEEEP